MAYWTTTIRPSSPPTQSGLYSSRCTLLCTCVMPRTTIEKILFAVTFKHIVAVKSVGSSDSLPFVVAFASTVLWTYYGILDDHNSSIIATNSIGIVLESVYIVMYMCYASYDYRTRLFKALVFTMVVVPLLILLTFFLAHYYDRVNVVDWVCTVSSLAVFVSPVFDVLRWWHRSPQRSYGLTMAYWTTTIRPSSPPTPSGLYSSRVTLLCTCVMPRTTREYIRLFKALVFTVVAVPLLILLTFFLAHYYDRVNVVGWVCTVSSLAVYVSPVFDVVRVIKTRDYRQMSFLLSFTFTCSGDAWMTYGLVADDYSVVIVIYAHNAVKSVGSSDSLPFVVAFASTILWTYYGILDDHNSSIIATNSIGIVFESVYIVMYMCYASYDYRIRLFKALVFTVVVVPLLILLTFFLAHYYYRVNVVDWVCTVSSLAVFVSPIFDVVRVIKTRDYQQMSFLLSFTFTCSGEAWMTYGLVADDYSVVASARL
ncbi:hypothetical protein CASFOL_019703 [Castilleja foliolosa]|uniref:Uncharacterized protein n=1 Tax=Castilleja foliolosa TaxID=1961234 RepID=A0ABD3D2A5_9LAMI